MSMDVLTSRKYVEVSALEIKPEVKTPRLSISLLFRVLNRHRMSKLIVSSAISRSCNQHIDLNAFKLGQVIGRGAFGEVRRCSHRESGKALAIKYVDKMQCIARGATANVIRERKLLSKLDHPLIVNMHYAFQTRDHLLLVLDLMLGGDLRYHLARKTVTEQTAKHWIAETAAALEYLHCNAIVHRDVKPENILLDNHGHAHLTDFNISARLRRESPSTETQGEWLLPRTRSGSPIYMAPEIHAGNEYDFAVDWWSLGVVLYESIYGQKPFSARSVSELADVIVGANDSGHKWLKQPKTDPPVSEACRGAIEALLEREPRFRLKGSMTTRISRPLDRNSPRRIETHDFFSGMDWQALRQGLSRPPFVPEVIGNFDPTWALETVLLDEAKPRSTPRADRTRDIDMTCLNTESCGMMNRLSLKPWTNSSGENLDQWLKQEKKEITREQLESAFRDYARRQCKQSAAVSQLATTKLEKNVMTSSIVSSRRPTVTRHWRNAGDVTTTEPGLLASRPGARRILPDMQELLNS
ncbi:Serine/threonine kinase [Savitreella phatthalungensis]